VEIQCPGGCPYLASAREHPSAAAVRRQQRDLELLVQRTRDLSERQSQLFFVISISAFLLRYEPSGLHPLVDDDVAEAAAALAGTFETAARGVIYEHRPAALPADRLATALKGVIAEAGQQGGSAFDRDAAVVLRRIEAAVRDIRPEHAVNRRAYLELVGRVLGNPAAENRAAGPDGAGGARLIVP
jgi:hypothetical protein